MEPFLAEFIKNNKIPKIVRDLVIVIVCGFIIFLGILVGISSPMVWGKIFGYILAVMFLIILIYLIMKVHSVK